MVLAGGFDYGAMDASRQDSLRNAAIGLTADLNHSTSAPSGVDKR
jgi:hypothetical protein